MGQTSDCRAHWPLHRRCARFRRNRANEDVSVRGRPHSLVVGKLELALSSAGTLVVSAPLQILSVAANALVVHPNAITVLGVVWAVGRRETQAVVCLHQRFAFGEQREPPRFEFSFRHACRYALYGPCVPVSRRIVPACCRFGH
jgi:hypothetical protein